MSTNPNMPDLSFLEGESATNFHIKDLLYTLLRNLHWLILFGVAGALLGNLQARRQDRVYASSANVVLRDNFGGNGTDSREASINRFFSGNAFYNTSINNEIMLLTSKSTMEQTIANLHLNINYYSISKVVKRRKDLYGLSPVEVTFVDDNTNGQCAFTVTPLGDQTVEIQCDEKLPGVTVRLNDTVATPYGRIAIHPTWHYTPDWYNEEISVEHVPLQAVVDHYRAAVHVDRDNELKNTIINISLRDLSPQRAADVINELIHVYNEDAIHDKKRIIAYTYDYINERISQVHDDMDEQVSEIAAFKRNNQLLDLSSYGTNFLDAANQYSKEVENLQEQRELILYLKKINDENTEGHLLPSGFTFSEGSIGTAIAHYNELTLQIKQSKESGNPVVHRKLEEQRKLKESLSLMLDVYVQALDKQIADAQVNAKQSSGLLQRIPDQQVYIGNVERLQRIKENLYTKLLLKREELLITQPVIEGNAKIIDEARPNYTPVSPNTARSTAIGLVLGLLIPIGLFVIRRVLDTKVHFHSDIKQWTTIPFLCEIPKRKKNDTRDIVVADGRLDSLSESFRLLRSKIDFFGDRNDGSGRIFMITSLLPASGKTFVSSNLAASFALSEKRVMLIDLDLRKGSLSHRFHSRRKPGMSNYLAGKITNIETIIQHDSVAPGLDTIFSGMLPPNPTELLGNGRIDTLLQWLRERYDYIFLDSAPLTVVDNNTIQHLVDSTIFVVRSEKYDKRVLAEMEEMYQSKTFNGMSVMLNDVTYQRPSPVDRLFGLDYGYGYGYGHRYSYSYAYQDYAYQEDPKEQEQGI